MVNEDYIKKIRKHIDRIDMVIITALAERMSLMPEIGNYKKEKNIPVFDEKREIQIMDRLKKVARENGLEESFVEEIFLSIFNEAKRIQQEYIEK
ncbi:MAG: chorismate mutase [Nanoarchaeota archaeon]|nr:chorismate mutase [Nanoarchaeota archaeon]MBU1704880.1 chorismate mutase [Nanoarchaeota archaeon]